MSQTETTSFGSQGQSMQRVVSLSVSIVTQTGADFSLICGDFPCETCVT